MEGRRRKLLLIFTVSSNLLIVFKYTAISNSNVKVKRDSTKVTLISFSRGVAPVCGIIYCYLLAACRLYTLV